MKRKFQVFISSTYRDMESEREAAVDAILRAGHIPAGMELFAANNEAQWQTIQRWIRECDIFLLILGGRYGSIHESSGKSYTQREFEFAVKEKKPYFSILISPAYLNIKRMITAEAIETKNPEKLEVFREEIQSKSSRFYENCDQIKSYIFESLKYYEDNEAIPGWIKSTQLTNADTASSEKYNLLKNQYDDLKKAFATMQSDMREYTNLLNESERHILMMVGSERSQIVVSNTMHGYSMQIGQKEVIQDPKDGKEMAKWNTALQGLVKRRLIYSHGRNVYSLNADGDELYERLFQNNKESAE